MLGRELRPVGGAEGAGRLAAVQGAVAAGYARALQERTRREQQEVTASAFAARTAAEQARWASEARFQAVFADALIGIGLADTEGRIVDFNRAMCEILGRTPEELSNGTIWTFVHPEDVPGLWDRTKELLAGERNHLRLEKAYFRPDGSEVWTDLVLSLIRDPDGSPLLHGGDDGEHHRAPPVADPPAAPGAARSPHGTAEPHPVLRAARGRAAGRDPSGRLLPGSRRVQGRQRHARPRPRRPAAARGRPTARRRRGQRRAPGGPHGGRRVRRAGRRDRGGRSGERTPAQRGADGARGRTAPDPARRERDRRVREHRRGPRRRRPRRRRAHEGGRHHALLGQGGRPQPVRAVRRGPPPQRRRPLRALGPDARRADPWRVQPGVPAPGPAGRPLRTRRGGAPAVDAARRQAARPGPVRAAGRRQRVHRAPGPLGAPTGLPATPRPGRPRTRTRSRS